MMDPRSATPLGLRVEDSSIVPRGWGGGDIPYRWSITRPRIKWYKESLIWSRGDFRPRENRPRKIEMWSSRERSVPTSSSAFYCMAFLWSWYERKLWYSEVQRLWRTCQWRNNWQQIEYDGMLRCDNLDLKTSLSCWWVTHEFRWIQVCLSS